MWGNDMETNTPTSPRQLIQFSLMSGECVLQIEYRDKKGQITRRKVSPIRWNDDQSKVLALCLCREIPRWFEVEQIMAAEQVPEESVLMPETIEILDPEGVWVKS